MSGGFMKYSYSVADMVMKGQFRRILSQCKGAGGQVVKSKERRRLAGSGSARDWCCKV